MAASSAETVATIQAWCSVGSAGRFARGDRTRCRRLRFEEGTSSRGRVVYYTLVAS